MLDKHEIPYQYTENGTIVLLPGVVGGWGDERYRYLEYDEQGNRMDWER